LCCSHLEIATIPSFSLNANDGIVAIDSANDGKKKESFEKRKL
jgi:hypothetical protein